MTHSHKSDDIRRRLKSSRSGSFLRDFVYGGVDGTVTTFAIVAGVQGAGLPQSIILVLGIANVLADGFSMAASNYSATKAELDNTQRVNEIERMHIRDYPEGEREEIRQILIQKNFTGQNLDDAVKVITSNEPLWIEMMLVHEYGISPVAVRPMYSAVMTFVAFILCGIIPLLAFLFDVEEPFLIASIATLITFVFIGALKSRWSLISWWRSALETLLIGSSAAAIAYFAGYLISLLTTGI